MPSSRHHDEQPRCDECGRYGDYVECHDAYLCTGCEKSADEEKYGALPARYFADATKDQKAEFDARMAYISAWKDSPRWERDRDAAKAKFESDTAAARALHDRSFEEMKQDGEISQETIDAWEALQSPQIAPRLITVGDHQAERVA